MSVARAHIRAISKRLFSGCSISPPPTHYVQITDKNKFSFLDTVNSSPWPVMNESYRWHVFIKKSCLQGDATEQEKMDFYTKTAAQAVGSEEEAKKRIYKVTRDCSLCGFGFETVFRNAEKIMNLACVEELESETEAPLFVNGELISWSLTQMRDKGRFPLPKPSIDSESESEE